MGTKRMISINYILKKLFVMLGLPSEDIKKTKSLKYYNQWVPQLLSNKKRTTQQS